LAEGSFEEEDGPVVRRESIEARLKELDEIIQELFKYKDASSDALKQDLSQRWIIERGLIAGASIIFDVSDHILSEEFGFYAESYEESLRGLFEKGVISEELYKQIRGLGGFRNILIHRYTGIDPDLVFENFHRGLKVFPRFAREVLAWMEMA
jgi:uncharacterized protein YutE (UPF0331/DUF86 family)